MNLVERVCPICWSVKDSIPYAEPNYDFEALNEYAFASRKLPEYMHYKLSFCITCRLIYACEIPSLEALTEAYMDADFDSADEAGYASDTYGKLVSSIVSLLPDLSGALDIGTGDGSFLQRLAKLHFQHIVGVEPSIAPIRRADSKVKNLIINDIFHANLFEKGSFRIITCFQTMEHLNDPLQVCKNIHELLKEQGVGVFVCHNAKSFSAKLLGRKSPIFDIEHLQLFSPESIRNLLYASGFSKVEVKPIYNTYPLHYWLKLLPIPIQFKHTLLKRIQTCRVGHLPIKIPAGNMVAFAFK